MGKVRDGVKYPTMHRKAPWQQKDDLASNVNNIEVEKPWNKLAKREELLDIVKQKRLKLIGSISVKKKKKVWVYVMYINIHIHAQKC